MSAAPRATGGAERVFWSAALTSAPVGFLDFLLPLWAATQLGAPPWQVGLIVSVEAALSLAARPLAGVFSDRLDRSRVAAGGAALYAVAFLGYAAASDVRLALAAAALQGIAGALFGVAVSSKVGEMEGGSRAYGKLLSWESSGAVAGFVVGFLALQPAGYRGIFVLGALACALAAAFLFFGRGRDRKTISAPGPAMRELWGRFWPGGTLGVWFVICAVLVLLAHLWLRRFPSGPLEMIWKRLADAPFAKRAAR